MTSLSEDPTYWAGGLILLAGAFLVALNLTQEGKYLIRAGAAFGLALVVVVIEWFWVTDLDAVVSVATTPLFTVRLKLAVAVAPFASVTVTA